MNLPCKANVISDVELVEYSLWKQLQRINLIFFFISKIHTSLSGGNLMAFYDFYVDYLRPIMMYHHKYLEYLIKRYLLKMVHWINQVKLHHTKKKILFKNLSFSLTDVIPWYQYLHEDFYMSMIMLRKYRILNTIVYFSF